MAKHPFKGYAVFRKYRESDNAYNMAKKMRSKGYDSKVHIGTMGEAHNNPRKVYRVLVKEK